MKRTFGKQNILPRLPVPDPHETCNKFVEWVQPLLSEEEFTKTKQIVDEFQSPGGDGEKLQKELIKWSQRSDISNWLEPLWDDMYLKSRSPVAISKNFSIVCEENPIGLNQVQRSAALILSALKFKSLIDKEELERSSAETRDNNDGMHGWYGSGETSVWSSHYVRALWK